MHKTDLTPLPAPEHAAADYNDIMRRIASVTRTHTQAGLAAALGIRQSSISDAKRRGTIPAEWYLRLFDTLGVNPDWLKKENGPIFLRTEAGYICPTTGTGDTDGAVVTVYNPACNTGDTLCPPLEACGHMTIPRHFAHPGILVFNARSDAFAPLIRKGAHVGIDTHQTRPRSGEIFAVLMPYEGIVLRRLYLLDQEDGFILRADNPAYPENHLAAADCARRMMGRLAWVMQTL